MAEPGEDQVMETVPGFGVQRSMTGIKGVLIG